MASDPRRFVVTGAGGSIGSLLCEQIVHAGSRRLTLVSLTESGLYNIERKLRAISDSRTQIIGMLGSVCDGKLMREACKNADVVIHAAAHKHVPLCESNPIAAIENNIRGTLTAATVAEDLGVKQFLLVSTDKAVRPSSVMGATKRVAEMIIADKATRSKRTIFTTVRFGNVLDSAGSVLPLWREQIASGGPLTLTDKRCERYFMSIPEACELIFGVLDIKMPGTFIFDMGEPKRLIDLAKQTIKESKSTCQIKSVGLRPGEKLTEELFFDGDLEPTQNAKIFSVSGNGKSSRFSMCGDLLNAASCRNKIMSQNYLWLTVSRLKLFALGFPKSGTCTIQSVLETAGFRVAHSGTEQGHVGALLCEDHAKGADPATRLPYDAIVHPSVCVPKKGVNYWPQMDLSLLKSLRFHHPDLVFCLNTRPVDHLVNSIVNWRDQQARYTEAEAPGLPTGCGTATELRDWILWHWATVREFFEGDSHFIEFDIEDSKASKKRLSEALDIKIKDWPCLNKNPR